MTRVQTVIIGGGQAGLAMSRCLVDRGIEHVVLERGRVGERWRSQRWDSLHLLTPRWQSRLPGFRYEGDQPDGYMSRQEVIEYLERYAGTFAAPVEEGVSVRAVECDSGEYVVRTNAGEWRCATVVIATGECDKPSVPAMASSLSRSMTQVVPTEYKNPGQLPDGGVLVVGASATGIQLAAEIQASDRSVTLSVGRHTRMPRTYRGRDIMWWLETMGVLSERADSLSDPDASRSQPSLQLVGGAEPRTLDLSVLQADGVRLVGRATDATGSIMRFEDDLLETVVAADVKLAKLRARIDAFVSAMGADDEVEAAEPFVRTQVVDSPTHLDLQAEGICTVVWATGYRREYPWLRIPILDAWGEIRHRGGVTEAPGVYVMGLRLLRRRNSSFIDGQAQDAADLAEHLERHLRRLGGCRTTDAA